MMNERPDWTERLGDAWLAQGEQVMDTVQGLRARAWAAGSLQSNEQQQVIVQDRVIAIESWRPGLLWVPYYNPLIVFGAWWWPAHRPFAWVPPPAYRPPHFGPAYASGMVWGPTVPLRARLWREPPPVVWRHAPGYPRGPEYRAPQRDRSLPPPPPRDRFGALPPHADPGHRAPSDRQWRGPEPDGRWQQRPAPARVMPEHDRAAPRQPAPPRIDAPPRPDAPRGARDGAGSAPGEVAPQRVPSANRRLRSSVGRRCRPPRRRRRAARAESRCRLPRCPRRRSPRSSSSSSAAPRRPRRHPRRRRERRCSRRCRRRCNDSPSIRAARARARIDHARSATRTSAGRSKAGPRTSGPHQAGPQAVRPGQPALRAAWRSPRAATESRAGTPRRPRAPAARSARRHLGDV